MGEAGAGAGAAGLRCVEGVGIVVLRRCREAAVGVRGSWEEAAVGGLRLRCKGRGCLSDGPGAECGWRLRATGSVRL